MFKALFKSKEKPKEMVKLVRYKPVFITVDLSEHAGMISDWAITNRIRDIPKHLMYDIKSDGYIKDRFGVMYILSNIISIEWKKVEEKEIEDTFGEYQCFVKAK